MSSCSAPRRGVIQAGVIGAMLLAAPTGVQPALAEIVEIDQARVEAGGITPGDTPGFPVEINSRGHYRLTSPLIVPEASSSAFQILAKHVTLDLNGFSILGNNALIGINAPSRGPLTIANGTIQGFRFYGIQTAGEGSIFENLRIIHNGLQGLIAGSGARITKSTFAFNGTGVRCEQGCLIEGNNIHRNAPGVGIQIQSGMILGNLIWGNRLAAIHVGSLSGTPDGGTVGFGDNTLFENNRGGAQLSGTAPAHLRPNHCVPACQPGG